MKNILLIGGPTNLQGIDRIDDDLLSILSEDHLYDRQAVIVWPTKSFLSSPKDFSTLEPYLDMYGLKESEIGRQNLLGTRPSIKSGKKFKALGEESLSDPGVRSRAIEGNAVLEVVHLLSKLVLAVTGGQNLAVVITNEAPSHSLCWTKLVDSWKSSVGKEVQHYDSKSVSYGVLNSIKKWPLAFDGLNQGEMKAEDLLPLDKMDVLDHKFSYDDLSYPEAANTLPRLVTVEYPVLDRLGTIRCVQVNTEAGYMLVVPEPDKPRNFVIGLKTGGVKKVETKGGEIGATKKKRSASVAKYMTRKEVANELRCAERTVDRHLEAGKLQSVKAEGKVLILKSSVDKMLER